MKTTLTPTSSIEEIIEYIFEYASEHPQHDYTYPEFGLPDDMNALRVNVLAAIDKLRMLRAIDTPHHIVLTDRGYKIIEHGGWRKYQEYKKRKRELAIEQIEASIRVNKLVEKSHDEQSKLGKRTLFVAIITMCAIIGQVIVAIIGLSIPKEQQSPLVVMQSPIEDHSHLQDTLFLMSMRITMLQGQLAKQDSLLKKLVASSKLTK